MLKARLAAMQGTKKIKKKKDSESENESDSDSP
jgi:hypothetical protein